MKYIHSKRPIIPRALGRLSRYTSRGINSLSAGASYLSSLIRHNGVAAYWWTGQRNFGDLITPLLLKFYGLSPIYKPPDSAELVSTGSILEHIPSTYRGTILGSGFMHDRNGGGFPEAHIVAVRGELTRSLINAPPNTVLGDPGLLARYLFRHAPSKKYRLGLVPHYSEKYDERLQWIVKRYPREVTLIDVQRNPTRIFYHIDLCEVILSSSLHGLVTADSLGIPSVWLKLSDKVIKSGGFKFHDYYSALGVQYEPYTLSGHETLDDLIALTHVPPKEVDRVCIALDGAFRAFAAETLARSRMHTVKAE